MLDPNKVGEVIRKTRKEKGLRLEDLSDDQISPATISNIERGIPHVKADKTVYLMDKIGIDSEDLPNLIETYQVERSETEIRLKAIECMIDAGKTKEALDQLKEIRESDHDPFGPTIYFLEGKGRQRENNWPKAERAYFTAIQLASKPEDRSNIEAASFNELGRCAFFQNRLDQAIDFTESGLDAFNDKGDRTYYKHILLANKTTYLEKLGRLEEANRIIHEMWEDIETIKSLPVVLLLYKIRSNLYRKSKMYDDAVQCALEGIELARINGDYDRTFDLWAVLGNTYLMCRKADLAKTAFYTALSLAHSMQVKNTTVNVYAQLGALYMEEGQYLRAEAEIQKGIEIAREVRDHISLSNALIVLGECFIAQGKNKEAIYPLEEALEISKKLKLENQETRTLLLLSQAWEPLDEKKFTEYVRQLYKIEVDIV
ncbi:tetratricopeptide repeat protein [Paludifilum halophilum]|nr:tetratricopeptide repeat protein [Paludifilum halophilum]